jgi:hypothetical protein
LVSNNGANIKPRIRLTRTPLERASHDRKPHYCVHHDRAVCDQSEETIYFSKGKNKNKNKNKTNIRPWKSSFLKMWKPYLEETGRQGINEDRLARASELDQRRRSQKIESIVFQILPQP